MATDPNRPTPDPVSPLRSALARQAELQRRAREAGEEATTEVEREEEEGA